MIRLSFLPCLAWLWAFSRVTLAQEPIPIDGSEPTAVHGLRLPPRPIRNAGSGLPIWHYQVTSPVDGVSYTGYMVGSDPFGRGPRTITIPVVLVPFVVQFTNTTTGFTATFDPSAAPDTGCTSGLTAMSLVEDSPIFQTYPWTLNGVDVGVTQYIDAFQQSNFWTYIQGGYGHHTLLTYTIGEPLTLPLSYSS